MANMKPMVGYIRVSSEKQAESGLSLEAQDAKIRAMAALKGVALADVVVDAAESAKDLNRPGVQRVLKMVRSGAVSGIIIAKLDRLTRNVRNLADILDLCDKKNTALVSVSETLDTGTAVGRMVINIMVSVAQWEREAIGERTSDALQAKRARGERAGNIPYGFTADTDGMLQPNPEEQRVIAEIKQLRADGRALREIADALNADGFKTRRGTEWQFQYVANVLKGAK
jgi:site-specific DNA recombinase